MADKNEKEQTEDAPLPSVIRVKQEPNNMKDFAEDTMNELLGWYGYGKVGREDTQHLQVAVKQLVSRGNSPGRHSPPSTSNDREAESPCDLRINSRDGDSENEDIEPTFTESDSLLACAWCQRKGNRLLTLETSSGRRHFCSEQCFTQSRRASFKRNRVCDWCRHVRHTMNFVDFQDGENQLQFCSDKCLNQYKMNIFCRETQEHLRTIQPKVSDNIGKTKSLSKSKQILITPDLWLKDDEQDAPLNLKAQKSDRKYDRHSNTFRNLEDKKNKVNGSTKQKVFTSLNSPIERPCSAGDMVTPLCVPVLRDDKLQSWKGPQPSRLRHSNVAESHGGSKSETVKQARRIHSLLTSHAPTATNGSSLKANRHSSSSSISPSSIARRSPLLKTQSPSTTNSFGISPPTTRSSVVRSASVASSCGSSTPAIPRTPVTIPGQTPLHFPHPFLFPPAPPLANFPLPFFPPHPLASVTPPTTCLVPFPIVLPFPVPIPIPIPIESSKWEAMKRKAAEEVTSNGKTDVRINENGNDSCEVKEEPGQNESSPVKSDSVTVPNQSSVSDDSNHSALSDISTNGVRQKSRSGVGAISLPRADHAYSLRRSLILDAPNIPRKRYRSPSPGQNYNHKRRMNARINNK